MEISSVLNHHLVLDLISIQSFLRRLITDFSKKDLHTLEPLIFKLNYTFSPHFTTTFHHPTPTFMHSSKGHTQNPPQQQGQCRRGHGAGAVVGTLLPLFALLRGVLGIELAPFIVPFQATNRVGRFFWRAHPVGKNRCTKVEIKKSVPQVLGVEILSKTCLFFFCTT